MKWDPKEVATVLTQEQQDSQNATANLLATLSPSQLARKELAMLNLVAISTSTGYGGRVVLELAPDPALGAVEWAPIVHVGDIVSVSVQASSKSPSKAGKSSSSKDGEAGQTAKEKEPQKSTSVVVKVQRESLSVAADVDDVFPDTSGRLWLVKLDNDAVFKRMFWAISKIDAAPSPVAQLMMGTRTARVEEDEAITVSEELNEPQKKAVRYACGSNASIIHGPPGTGKTKTVVEIVLQLARRGERVLVCGPSNVAVDNIVERLSPYFSRRKQDLVRLGHPARLSESVLQHSVDLLARSSNEGEVLRDLQREIASTRATALSRKTRGKERHGAFLSLKELRRDYRLRETRLTDQVLRGTKVVAATLHGAGGKDLGAVAPLFDTIVIDEVSQALLPQCWIPAVIDAGATRLVIAGDSLQLPPTITSNDPGVQRVLETTLFDVMLAYHGENIRHFLSVQYRMCTEIMMFPSLEVYDGRLEADKSVATQVLFDLPDVERTPTTESRVVWIDTMNSYCFESKEEDGFSVRNEGEAEFVMSYINRLLKDGVPGTEIGVIAPYNAQVGLLRKILAPEIEVSSVDGFQGREKEVIVLSLVRSNEDKDVGFVSDKRRINVAITRPRRQLCIVGNSETIGHTGFLKQWVDWCEENADIEYPE